MAAVICSGPVTLTAPQRPPPIVRGTPPAARAVSPLERGIAAYNADDLDAAMDAFEEAVRLTPREPEAHINLGLVYLRLQRTEDAMRELAVGASLAQCKKHAHKRSRRHRCSD